MKTKRDQTSELYEDGTTKLKAKKKVKRLYGKWNEDQISKQNRKWTKYLNYI